MVEPEPGQPILLLATTNAHKLTEYRSILAGVPAQLRAPTDLGIVDDVEEGVESFLANARLKAQAYRAAALARGVRPWVLADDSGLEVDALGGAPGVLSTRWAGPDTTPAARNRLLLARLADVPPAQRGARFRCVIVLLSPDGAEFVAEGAVAGRIAFAPRYGPGLHFGYDPIFELPARGLTLDELPPATKDAISHRGIAGRQARAILLARLEHDLGPGASER